MSRTQLTKLGKVFLALAAAFYLASVTSQSSLLLCLVALLSTCLAVNLFQARRTTRGIRLEPPGRLRCVEGEPLREPWTIRNVSSGPAFAVTISLRGQRFFWISHLAAKSEAALVAAGQFPTRGVYQGCAVEARSDAPFGLVQATHRSELAADVVVYPKLYPIEAPLAAGFDQVVGGKQSGKHRVASGSQFAGVRPWINGDSIKSIHWKSSARGQGLMVKQFEEELSGRTAVLLFLNPGSQPARREAAIRAAGSLIFAGLDAGNHVDLIDTASMRGVSHAPFEDGEAVLERLARLDASLTFAGKAGAALELAHPKAARCLVCAEWDAAAKEFAQQCAAGGRPPQVFAAQDGMLPAMEIPWSAQPGGEAKRTAA